MRRHTLKEVESNLKRMGLKLLSQYLNNKTEVKIKHIECGYIFNRTFNHLKKNPKCPKCFPPKTTRKSIETVRELVESKQGHKLLSLEYINSRTPIDIECSISGQRITTTLKSYMKSKGCKACFLKKIKDMLKQTRQNKLKEIRAEMGKEGYILKAKEYINNKQKLEYICPQGHHNSINWNNCMNGQRCFDCNYEGMKETGNPRWLGGLVERNLASYNTYAPQLEKYERIRIDHDEPEILQVCCTHCGQWFRPKRSAVKSRLEALDTADGFENRLYCSEKCKQECEVYRKSSFQCIDCGSWFVGGGSQKYCDNCSPYRKTFSLSTKTAIYERDLRLGRIKADSKYEIHHILNVAEFPELADEEWNGWAIDLQSDLHSTIHNVCGLSKVDSTKLEMRSPLIGQPQRGYV